VKVIRVGLSTLKNLADDRTNIQQMVEAGGARVLDNLLQRKKWGDSDIEANLDFLSTTLQKCIAEMSSFDVYKSEVLSGNLDWTPVHRSEKFWRENFLRFEEHDFEVLSILVNIVRSSSNVQSLAIACFDIGEFVRFHPRGRTIISALGAKVSVMKLMTHSDEEVKKQALLCVQKMMVINWQYLPS